MKKQFKYKLTKLLWILFIAGLLIAGACVFLNVKRFIGLLQTNDKETYNYISSILSSVVGFLAFVFIPPAMFSSKYVITDKQLLACWGLVKNRFEINDITTITHFRKTEKLVVYFADDSYTVIIISPEEFNDFANALKEVNNKIFYQLNTEDSGEK